MLRDMQKKVVLMNVVRVIFFVELGFWMRIWILVNLNEKRSVGRFPDWGAPIGASTPA